MVHGNEKVLHKRSEMCEKQLRNIYPFVQNSAGVLYLFEIDLD